MEAPTSDLQQLATTSRRLAQRLLTIGENRLVLLTVELQEERERLLHAAMIALIMAAFGLLGGMTLTAAAVVLLWPYAPVTVLLGLTVVYGVVAILLWRRTSAMLRDWRTFPASLEQFRKDRITLEAVLS
jgi:uncharacterized membrane protein YqjE